MKFFITCLTIILCISSIKASSNKEIDIKTLNDSLVKYIGKDNHLKHFYQDNQNSTLWVGKTLNNQQLEALINILNDSESHGLSPEIFNKEKISHIVDSLSSNKYSNTEYYEALARLETLATKATINYVKALKFGHVSPKKILPNDYFIETIQPDSIYYTYINKLIISDPISAMIKSQPKNDIYIKMQEKLKVLNTIKDSTFVQISISTNQVYKLNDENRNIGLIADRLMLTGEYQYNGADSLKNILTHELMIAINKFRRENSYPEDEEVGNVTITALNRPVSYYYKKLRANMERYRWQRVKKRTPRRVEVNVAPFYLFAYDNNDAVLDMKVCVGTVANRTPLMQSNISYMNLNPVWNVPTSITQKELYHSIKKDPEYLKRRNMTMHKGGKPVDPSTIDWSATTSSTFNYSISQGSGDGNSLGRIKFMFPNRFAVYLHDTPSKSAFLRKNRAVSHGCVRLEKPIDFAQYCASKLDDLVYRDQVLYSIDRAPESAAGKDELRNNRLKRLPNIINLDKTIPLSIDYYTVYKLPEKDNIVYADDVYGHDNAIVNALDI